MMRQLISKQQQNLKQNLSKFENRASQITYSLNKIQYLLINNQENEQNKEFLKNEYEFLQTLVAQVGQDLKAFQSTAAVLHQFSNDKSQPQDYKNNHIYGDEIKIEEEEAEKEKDQNSGSNYDDIEEDDDDDEYQNQRSSHKSKKHQGMITRKKKIEKDQIYYSGLDRISDLQRNIYDSSTSQSLNEALNSGQIKEAKQIRKKKYSNDLRKKLCEEVNKKSFSYRKICKKYNINYGTAYYLINTLQKDDYDSNSESLEPDNDQQQLTNQSGNNNEALSNNNSNVSNNNSNNISNNNKNSSNIDNNSNYKNNKSNNSENNKNSNNNNNVKTSGGTTLVEKQNLHQQESGRGRYPEALKQKLYIELMSGLSYKEISDRNKIAYETCYYLISTVKTQASKDQQLNKQLKAQIAQFKEQLIQNKANGSTSKSLSNKQNTIPTSTTLTRAQQAMLNGTTNLNEKKSDTIEIEVEEDEDNKVNGEKKVTGGQELNNNNNNKNEKVKIEIKEELKLEQELGDLNDQSSEQLKKQIKQNEQEQSQNEQNKESQSSTKGGLLSENE
ncbi:hypothetical protein ABPG74_021558 [Tetrahymena malaccensis]